MKEDIKKMESSIKQVYEEVKQIKDRIGSKTQKMSVYK